MCASRSTDHAGKTQRSDSDHFSRRPTIKPATNASPAPETSTTSSGNCRSLERFMSAHQQSAFVFHGDDGDIAPCTQKELCLLRMDRIHLSGIAASTKYGHEDIDRKEGLAGDHQGLDGGCWPEPQHQAQSGPRFSSGLRAN